MSDDPAPRITAALEMYQAAERNQAAITACPSSRSKNRESRAAYDRKLVATHELANVVAAEWPPVLARLAAADAFVAAYTAYHEPWVLESSREGLIAERAMAHAVAAYHATRGRQAREEGS